MRILHLEDDPKDAELIQATLEGEGIACDITRVDTPAAFRTSLEQGGFDLVLAEYTLSGLDGISALKVAKDVSPDMPFIFVSRTLGEEDAIEALKLGATDYVSKTRLSRIIPSVRRAMRESKERVQRQLAEQTLRESEAYLAEAQRLSHTGSFRWKPDSGEINWSDETYRIFEYDRAVKPTIDLLVQRVHPEDRPDFLNAIESASAGATQFEHTYRWLLPDGSVKHVHALAHALQGASGNREFVGAATDVTSIKRAEEELHKSEACLAEAQRLTHTGSCAIDGTSRETVYWSDEMFRIFGFDPQQGLPMFDQWLQRIHPEDRDKVKLASEKTFLTKVNCDIEFRIVKPDGTVKHIHGIGHPVLSATGEFVQVHGTMVDVTERKRAEQTLRQSEAYLAEAQRLSQTGSWASKPFADSRYWSEECYRVLGFDPAGPPPLFEEFFQRIHPDDQAASRERWERAIRDKADFEFGYRIVHPNKGIRDIHVLGHAVLNQSGDLDEFVGTVIDVTERKGAEQELQQLVDFVPQLVVVFDSDGKVIHANRVPREYTGLTLQE